MRFHISLGAHFVRKCLGASLCLLAVPAWAALGTSVTLSNGSLTDIYPGQTTTLRITLSNSNSVNPVAAVAFSNALPGTLPNGLRVSGVATYSCADGNGTVATSGTLSAVAGSQSIDLSGASVPAKVGATDGSCVIDIPVSAGKFDIEDYTLYLVEFMRHLGPDTHVIAVCQPAPLALAATAYLAAEDPDAQPRTLTLIGGPIDPDAAACPHRQMMGAGEC